MNILSLIVFLPMFGAFLCLLVPKRQVRTATPWTFGLARSVRFSSKRKRT